MFYPLKALLVAQVYAATPKSLTECAASCPSIFYTGGFGQPGLGFRCLTELLLTQTERIVAATGTLSLIMLMINGFRYMYGPAVPGGSSDAAKKGIGAALLGLALSLLTYLILDTIIQAVTQ